VPERKEAILELTPADGFFDDAVVYFVAFQSFVHSTEIYNAGVAVKWPDNDVASFDAKQVGMRLSWAPTLLMNDICANRMPSSLKFVEAVQEPIATDAVLNLGAIDPLLYSFGQAMITNYFERQLKNIERTFSKDRSRWPAVWNFGRVVRNSMSHGGRIFFENKKAPAVSWRQLSYSPADNDRVILHRDLWPADLIYLLRDMDQFVRSTSTKA
jgi:hypothetical protein